MTLNRQDNTHWPSEYLKCHYHNEQFIQNFCSCVTCLLPLCPKCIKAHTDDHCDRNTCSNIETFQETVERAQKEIQEDISRLSRHLHQLQDYNEDKYIKVVQEELFKARKEAFSQLEAYFQKLESALISDTKIRMQDFYSTPKGPINQQLLKQKQVLEEYQNGMNRYSLSGLIKYLLSNEHDKIIDLEDTLGHRIHTFQQNGLHLKINKALMHECFRSGIQIVYPTLTAPPSALQETISFRNRAHDSLHTKKFQKCNCKQAESSRGCGCGFSYNIQNLEDQLYKLRQRRDHSTLMRM